LKKKCKVGLALGGGGAKGMSYVGIFKVLERHKIPIDYVSGTSIGAVFGALYCAGYSADEIEKIISEMSWKKLVDFSNFGDGLIEGKAIEKTLAKLLKGKSFENLRIPLAVTAVDLASGEEVVFESGDLVRAVHASTAIPGVFCPVKIDHRSYVDGGVIDPVPVGALRQKKVDVVIAVNLSTPGKRLKVKKMPKKDKNFFVEQIFIDGFSALKNVLRAEHIVPRSVLWALTPERFASLTSRPAPRMLNNLLRSYNLMMNELSLLKIKEHDADIVISPKVGNIGLFDFFKSKSAIRKGKNAAARQIGLIKKRAGIR
tara:strand:+ start:373 stop:1317 length:945 start_codon:yes stop_codon:yes gene_type:complete